MNLQLPTNARGGDIINSLENVRQAISQSYRKAYLNEWVTKETCDNSPSSKIVFSKDKIPLLKAAGLMNDSKDYSYGYCFSNEYLAKVVEEFRAIESLIDEICDYLDGQCQQLKDNNSVSKYDRMNEKGESK